MDGCSVSVKVSTGKHTCERTLEEELVVAGGDVWGRTHGHTQEGGEEDHRQRCWHGGLRAFILRKIQAKPTSRKCVALSHAGVVLAFDWQSTQTTKREHLVHTQAVTVSCVKGWMCGGARLLPAPLHECMGVRKAQSQGELQPYHAHTGEGVVGDIIAKAVIYGHVRE